MNIFTFYSYKEASVKFLLASVEHLTGVYYFGMMDKFECVVSLENYFVMVAKFAKLDSVHV